MERTAAVEGPSRSRAPAAVATTAAISAEGLRRDFGDRVALDDLSFSLAPGESLAVLGPNGSGKSTLLRILAGLLRPSGGQVAVLGSALPKETYRLRGRIGYLGHEPLLYRDLTPRENLSLAASLNGIDETSGQTLHAGRTYDVEKDVRWGHRYADMVRPRPNGGFLVEMHKFDEVQPTEPTEAFPFTQQG